MFLFFAMHLSQKVSKNDLHISNCLNSVALSSGIDLEITLPYLWLYSRHFTENSDFAPWESWNRTISSTTPPVMKRFDCKRSDAPFLLFGRVSFFCTLKWPNVSWIWIFSNGIRAWNLIQFASFLACKESCCSYLIETQGVRKGCLCLLSTACV